MLVDSHCHLDFPDFADDVEQVVARAHDAGIGLMVSICTHVRKFDQVHALTRRFANVYCSIGTHPHQASREIDVPIDDLLSGAKAEKVIAIGEAGLDYHYDYSTVSDQKTVFRRHIEAARMTGLPLIIHSREAEDDTAAILEEEMAKGPFSAVLHCFTSGPELAQRGLALGLYISFSGMLSFKNADALRAIAAQVPIDRLLVETDAPFLAPVPKRGQRNEPAFVRHTAAVLAELKGVSETDMARATTDNFFALFNAVPRAAHTAAGVA
jgi:TatD DNase family protein